MTDLTAFSAGDSEHPVVCKTESKENNRKTIEIVTPIVFASLFANKTVYRADGCLTEFSVMDTVQFNCRNTFF